MNEMARELRVPPALVENVFRMAEAMGGRHSRVYLSDLRKRFPRMPRQQLDQILVALDRQGKIVLMPIEDPLTITPERETAAIILSEAQRHFLRIRK